MVAHPGVYRLSAGARTYEAIAAAGGAAKGSDQNALSLAARVADGATILVPAKSRVTAGAASGSSTLAGSSAGGSATAPVSLSSATAEQLDGLDGIGPALAKRIVEWRDAHGGFGSLADLDSVPGIGPAKLAALKGAVVP